MTVAIASIEVLNCYRASPSSRLWTRPGTSHRP